MGWSVAGGLSVAAENCCEKMKKPNANAQFTYFPLPGSPRFHLSPTSPLDSPPPSLHLPEPQVLGKIILPR